MRWNVASSLWTFDRSFLDLLLKYCRLIFCSKFSQWLSQPVVIDDFSSHMLLCLGAERWHIGCAYVCEDAAVYASFMKKNNFLQRFCWKSHFSSHIAGIQYIVIESHSCFFFFWVTFLICVLYWYSPHLQGWKAGQKGWWKESLEWYCISVVISRGSNWQWDSQGINKLWGHIFLAI